MGFRKSLGAIAVALPVIGCVWTVYANTVGASIYPAIGTWGDEPATRVARSDFASRFEPLAAAAASAPGLMSHLALKAAMAKQGTVQVASADAGDVPVTSSVQVANAAPPQTKSGHRYYALLDANYSFGFEPDRFKPTQNNSAAPADAEEAIAEAIKPDAGKRAVGLVPAPPPVKLAMAVPTPPERKATTRVSPGPTRNPFSQEALVARAKAVLMAQKSESKSSFFDKLFGKPDAPALAYASADAGVTSTGEPRDPAFTPSDDDRYTAVYDITAKTVYMPDGTKLEAHSGLGARMDDPRHVNVRMQGATPPHIYDLKMREALFHGVAAIRLTPVGGEDMIHGRTGLLAHTYMLGPRGDSNGCVSFRDYNAFLQAFKRGEVKRLVVVASMT